MNLGTSQEETTTQQGSKLLFHIPNSNNVWYMISLACKPEPKQQDDSNRKKMKKEGKRHSLSSMIALKKLVQNTLPPVTPTQVLSPSKEKLK